MFQEARLLTPARGHTPAAHCLLCLAAGMPVFAWHWYAISGLLQQPGLAAVTRPAVLAGLNAAVLAALVMDAALALWLWPRRHRPDALPLASTVVAVLHAATLCLIGIAFGPLTSPIACVTISALLVGLALLDRRATVIGFIVAITLLSLSDWLVLGDLQPYAPALVPGTFRGDVPVAWWDRLRDYLFFLSTASGVLLVIWLFGRLDRQRYLLEELSRTDSLTGLSNRRHFMERLGVEQHRRDRYDLSFSVVFCDADHFKQVNDTYGHHAGDDVLREIGRLLGAGLRIPGDVAARLGGEEFALLLTDCREEEALGVCERLRRQLEAEEFCSDGQRFRVTMSLGVVECRAGSAEAALKAADLNLYAAKKAGRNRVVSSVQGAPAEVLA